MSPLMSAVAVISSPSSRFALSVNIPGRNGDPGARKKVNATPGSAIRVSNERT